jgi:hypothetical protein
VKKLHLVVIAALLIIGLLTWGIGPVMAQDNAELTKINKPFGVGQSDSAFAHNIPRGSTIYQRADGITEIRDANNRLILTAKDNEAALLPTPGGLRRATHILQLPPDSRIKIDGNITKIYEGERCILTAVERGSKTSSKEVIPDFDGWIEWTEDWTVAELDWFRAYWEVPSAPPNPDNDVVDFLFNAIETDAGNIIIQPVLEWNWGGSSEWTGAPWVVRDSPSFSSRGSTIAVSTGDTIRGTMRWDDWSSDWYTAFRNLSTGQGTELSVGGIPDTYQDVAVFCTLEGYNIYDNNDVPGDTTFYDMEFEYNSSTVDITWEGDFGYFPYLSGLYITIYSDNKVTLNTAN